MPISMPGGITIRTVTFWYPATHLGITDWRVPLATLFDDELRPERRLLAAAVQSRRARALLAAPGDGHPTRCAGRPVRLLDLPATAAWAAQEAQFGRARAHRPGRRVRPVRPWK